MEVFSRHKRLLSRTGEEGLNDLFAFLSNVWGLDLREKPHREMCECLEACELQFPQKPYSMLVVPRGTYKTSIARGWAVWVQLRRLFLDDNPYFRLALQNATLRLANASLRVIEWQLRVNKVLNETYGQLYQESRRGIPGSHLEEGLIWKPRIDAGETAGVSEPTFWVASMRAVQTGLHADAALTDDLNNRENVATDVQRKKTHEFWELLFPLLGGKDAQPARIAMLCTPWHDDDVRGMILRTERERAAEDETYESPWNVLHRGAIEEDGAPFFPEKYPHEKLEELRRAMSTMTFAANYLCDPIGDRGFVNAEEIVFKPREMFPALRDCRITVDPNQHSEAKDMGCYAAIVISGYDRFANLWVIDAKGSREWTTSEFIKVLFDIQDQYPDYSIYMEEPHMGHFAHAISMEEAERSAAAGRRVHLRINYVPVDIKTTKYQRWDRLQPRFANRHIFFSQDIVPSIKQELKDELIRGPVARFKDFLDALALAETGVMPRVGKDGQFKPIMEKGLPGKIARDESKFTFAHAFGSRVQ